MVLFAKVGLRLAGGLIPTWTLMLLLFLVGASRGELSSFVEILVLLLRFRDFHELVM